MNKVREQRGGRSDVFVLNNQAESYPTKEMRDPLSAKDINGVKRNQYGAKVEISEHIDPNSRAGQQPIKKDKFNNYYGEAQMNQSYKN